MALVSALFLIVNRREDYYFQSFSANLISGIHLFVYNKASYGHGPQKAQQWGDAARWIAHQHK